MFFFAIFSELLPKFSYFVNSNDCLGKLRSKSIRLQQFPLKKDFEANKNEIFCSEKRKIQEILFMIMLIRSSERIINPMRFTGLLDTGASVNIIDGDSLNTIKDHVHLRKCNTNIYSFQELVSF